MTTHVFTDKKTVVVAGGAVTEKVANEIALKIKKLNGDSIVLKQGTKKTASALKAAEGPLAQLLTQKLSQAQAVKKLDFIIADCALEEIASILQVPEKHLGPNIVMILRPDWIIACEKAGKLVDVNDFQHKEQLLPIGKKRTFEQSKASPNPEAIEPPAKRKKTPAKSTESTTPVASEEVKTQPTPVPQTHQIGRDFKDDVVKMLGELMSLY